MKEDSGSEVVKVAYGLSRCRLSMVEICMSRVLSQSLVLMSVREYCGVFVD